MNTIYIVLTADYYPEIHKVFLSKQKAEDFINQKENRGIRNEPLFYIEEHPIEQ